jgi:hypothetical protein
MNEEKIIVKVTGTGKIIDVVVLDKRARSIQIVLGEGVHSVKCGQGRCRLERVETA